MVLEGFHPNAYEHLWRYVHERETVLKEIINEKDCSRGEAKKNVLALMFKDPTKEWNGLSTFETSFEAEVKAIGDKLLGDEKNKGIDWVERSQKKHAGAGLSLLLQTKCASNLLITVVTVLPEMVVTLSALIEDCVTARKEHAIALKGLLERRVNVSMFSAIVRDRFQECNVPL